MKIRKGSDRDAASCLKIARLDKAKHWEIQDFKNSAIDRNAVFFVAENEGNVIGYILGFVVPTRHSEALIHETRIHRSFRRKGIGTALVERFCQHAFKSNVNTISALIDPKHLKFYSNVCKFKNVGKWIEVSKKRSVSLRKK